MAKLRAFFRLFIRPLAREPLRTALAILAVALGVAVVLAIAMAGDAATGSFLSSVQSLAGKSDFEVTATGGVSGQTVARLATLPYPLRVDPRIEGYAVVSPTAELVPLIGVDLIAGAVRHSPDMANFPWIQKTRCVWVSPGLATQGGKIELQINDRLENFNVCGLLPPQTAAQGGAVVMDIALASEVLDRGDKVDVALITVPRNGAISMNQWDRILRRALPPGAILKRFGAQARENQRMVRAFRWNLRVLSAIALIVGGFLIYNNLSVSVVRRRAEIGIVRALGGSRRFILSAFLGESLLYGLIGSVAGLALGRVLAAGAVRLISTTVQSLYLTSQPAPVRISGHMILVAFGLGAGVAIISALIPAYEASQVSPVEAMARARREHDTRTRRVRLLVVAALCAAAGYGAARMPAVDGTPLFGYAAALLFLASCALSIPAVVTGFAEATSGTVRRWASAETHLALRSLVASLRRTSVLLAALA
ncbi:MAG: ABC transporter permease, partial [Terriglobia bacterium]